MFNNWQQKTRRRLATWGIGKAEDARILLCSNCFKDQGLKLDAMRLGVENLCKCHNCHSHAGRKLNKKTIEQIAYRCFVLGTMQRGLYGGAPILQINYSSHDSITPAHWFESDLELMKKTIDARVFRYGPRLWMLREIEPLKALQDSARQADVVSRIIEEYPSVKLEPPDIFYRLRIGPKIPSNVSEYDSPPSLRSEYGRMDSSVLSVMYASQDLEVCIHECRATAEDEMYVATLSPARPLTLLNLNHLLLEENVTEFESLDLTVHMLFLAGKHSYQIIRRVASAALEAGFDGISYPSCFSLLRTGSHPFETQFGLSNRWAAAYLNHDGLAQYEAQKMIPNLALFGRPISDGIVKVNCLNRLSLKQVIYDGYFGPVGYS